MSISNYNKTSFIEDRVNEAFLYYEKDIIALHKTQWKDEDLNETSDKHFKVEQYYLVIQLMILIYFEIIRGVNLEWSYYINKYNLVAYKKCLLRHGINLDKILAIFQLPDSSSNGVNFAEIENSFIIENVLDQDSISSTNSFMTILEEGESCVINLETDCKYSNCN